MEGKGLVAMHLNKSFLYEWNIIASNLHRSRTDLHRCKSIYKDINRFTMIQTDFDQIQTEFDQIQIDINRFEVIRID